MKHGKKPTVSQKKFLQSRHMNPEEWLIVKDLPGYVEVVHRNFDIRKKVPKRWEL